jgi:hypothetical protein
MLENPHPETRGIWDRGHLPPESWMGVGLSSMVSDFPVHHPASWVGIFRGTFISLSSSLLCSAIGFLWFWLGDPSVPGSAIGSHRLLLPMVFQGFWLGVPLIFPESAHPSHVLFWLPSLTWAPIYGLGLVVKWRLRILPECLSRRHLRSGMTSESLNEVRFILTRWHRVPELGDKYIGQGWCPPQSTPPSPWNHSSHLVAM